MEQDNKGIPGSEKNPMLEAALANKHIARGETFNEDLLANASKPQEVFIALRAIQGKIENGDIPPNLTESYRPPAYLSTMFNRAAQLRITNAELEKKGWILKYNPDTGTAIPAKRVFAGLVVSTEETLVIDEKGDVQMSIFNEPVFRVTHNYGTEKERAELAKAYERGVSEMEARAILGEWVGVMLNLDARDDLNKLVNWQHSTGAKFKAGHLHALFNMPDISEMETNPENRTLGDQVEEAMVLNLIMLHSGNKQRMEDFLERPGVQHLISKMAKEEEARRGQGAVYTRDQWIIDNIGNVSKWVTDYDPKVDVKNDKEAHKKTRDLELTWKEESKDGRRGKLTKWGNMAAFGGSPGDMGGDDETEFIESTVGGLVGSVEASWIAASLFRSFGTYAAEGYVALPNGKSILPLGERGMISSDDRGKLWVYMFNMKEGTKGRKSGLKNMIGKIPDLQFDLFDWAQVAVDDLPLKPDGSKQRRSIIDAWLGIPGDKQKIDLLTGEKTNNLTKKEDYHRLGDLNFASLDRDFHGTFGIMQWLIGNEKGPTGVLTDALKTNFGYEDFELDELKAKWKYISIVMNPVVLTKGRLPLYDNIDSYKIIQKNFLRNLMIARVNSYAFSTKVINYTIPTTEPDIKEVGIPGPLLALEFIKEVLKENPSDEDQIKKHYIDSYDRLTTLAKVDLKLLEIKNAGTIFDRFKILTEEFLPEDPAQALLVKYVGKVTGKKKTN